MTEQTVVWGGEPAWDIAVAYALGDAVTHGGQTWQARADNLAVTPGTDATVWLQMTGGFDLETYYTLLADVVSAREASEATAAGNALHDSVLIQDLATLAADTTLDYGTGSPVFVQAGHLVRTARENHAYLVADSAATDHDVTTPGGVKMYVLPQDGEVWDAQWFDIADDADRVQTAVVFSIAYQKAFDGPIKVMVQGQYSMSHPIGLFDFDGSSFDIATVHLEAPASGYVENQRTTFTFTDLQNPGIVVHKCRKTVIRNITLKGGANNLLLPGPQQLLDRDTLGTPWWNVNGAVDEGAYKQHAGVVLDPFHSGQPAAERYSYYDGSTPGVPNHYLDNAGTTAFEMQSCEVQGWIIAINTAGSAIDLGDSITIRECNLSYNRIACQISDSQNRGVVIEDCHGKGHDILLAAGQGFGVRIGARHQPAWGNLSHWKQTFLWCPVWGCGIHTHVRKRCIPAQ